MDIGSRNSYPAGKLSNFTAFAFEIDGIKCASMEGFLQSLKFENKNSQEQLVNLLALVQKRKDEAEINTGCQNKHYGGEEYHIKEILKSINTL